MSSVKQDDDGSELDCGEERCFQLVVTGGDSTELFKLIEEALDQVPFPIKGKVSFPYRLPITFWRNDRRDSTLRQLVDQPVRIIPLIGEEGARFDIFEKRFSLGNVRLPPQKTGKTVTTDSQKVQPSLTGTFN
ncbi:hypothetical protein AA21952_2347 [Acetobacter oeni LMG 21952]|nr:hypothetical protein [Acetobacter oeni]GBR07453.1 hypothetical protein AA21952_2347 [Acetobacter oeni LMG 21952]